MSYYTSARLIFGSPIRQYFNTLDELNAYWGINATTDNIGDSFPINEEQKYWFIIGYEEDS